MGEKRIVKDTEALAALKSRLPGRVFIDETSRFNASIDNLRISFLPDAVVRIQKADEVREVLKLAYKYVIPVTARGAGSSATGSAVPLKGGWALDLSALDSIEINTTAKMATKWFTNARLIQKILPK